MCGIAGIVSLSGRPVDPNTPKRMCDQIAHRGPDDAGYVFFHHGRTPSGQGSSWLRFCDARFRHINEHLPVFGGEYSRTELREHDFTVALGQRRLSILDLSPAGHQPMCSPDRLLWVTHNGEIYNFPQLRCDLEQRGYKFRTRTDTEVILALWEEFGDAALSMLDGMFAFAIYDRRDNTLTLARDRFGVKPVYYAVVDGMFIFASEAKALFASRLLEAQIDPETLVEYMTFQNTFTRQTIWRGVHILQPGEMLCVKPGSGAAPTLRRYHLPGAELEEGACDSEEAVCRVAEVFGQAVRRQLIADVPVGSYLSGGMDSGSIVAVAGKEISRLHTFTGGFDLTNVNGIEQGFDERRMAEQLSHLLQTEHYDVVLHAGDMPAAMERLTWHMDDPRVGMCHQNWYAAKLASRFVKVCLAGTGGDELFAGYPWRYRPAFQCADARTFDDAMFASWCRLLPSPELQTLFSADLRVLAGVPRQRFDQVMSQAPAWLDAAPACENLVHRALYFEAATFLHGLLVTDDHISMAHSLETRVPFLDNALADLAWQLPPSVKLRMDGLRGCCGSNFVDSADGKHVLRRAMERYLPAEFVYNRKQGFSPPDENWYRGPSMDYIKSILLDPQTLTRPWFDRDVMTSKLNEHFEGRRNHRLLIWSLLSIEWIQRHYTDGPSLAPEQNMREARPGICTGEPVEPAV